MLKSDKSEMILVNSLRKKIKNDGKLCCKEVKKNSTWKKFKCASTDKKIILYGTGEMFEYFCKTYARIFDVAYAVDKNVLVQEGISRAGVTIFPIKKLIDEQNPYIVLVTPINGIDEIFSQMKEMGIAYAFSLPVMEYHRLSVKTKVWIASMRKTYQLAWKADRLEYRLQQKIDNMEQRIKGIQQRQTDRYLYLMHTNRVVNALIDKSDDDELKKEQMRYLFTEIHNNQYVPDFDEPKTFNEKILNMTLYNHNPVYTEVSDKYLFKKYVSEKVGDEYIVPLLGVWDNPEDIDFSALPNQFVLKATRGGDSQKVIIVKDKASMDYNEIVEKMKTWKAKYDNEYYYNFNWPFKNIRQRIIAEELLDIDGLQYYDFKVHCFHGEPKYIHVVSQNPHEVTHFDVNWIPQKFRHGYPLIHYDVPRPECLEKMLDLSRKLSQPFDYIRVDFYVMKDKLYLGELTLTTLGGLAPFEPTEIDYEWGRLI